MEEQAKYVDFSYNNDADAIYTRYYMGHDGVVFFDGENLSTHMHIISGLRGKEAVSLVGNMAYLLLNMKDGDSALNFKYAGKGLTKRELVKQDFDSIVGNLKFQETSDTQKKMRESGSI